MVLMQANAWCCTSLHPPFPTLLVIFSLTWPPVKSGKKNLVLSSKSNWSSCQFMCSRSWWAHLHCSLFFFFFFGLYCPHLHHTAQSIKQTLLLSIYKGFHLKYPPLPQHCIVLEHIADLTSVPKDYLAALSLCRVLCHYLYLPVCHVVRR